MEKKSVFETSKREKRKEQTKNRAVVALFMAPFFLNFTLFFLVPVFMGLILSFFQYNPYDSAKTAFVGFDNFVKLFTNPLIRSTFWHGMKTTLLFDVVAVPLMLLIPLGLAYLVYLEPPGYKIFRAVIYLPTVVSISIVGIIFGAMFDGASTGLINAWLGTEIKWMDGALRWVVIMLASIWWQTGTNFVILLAALKNVPKHLYEACEIDGGGRWHAFLYVTLPNIRGSLELCTFNTLIGYLSLYGQPTVLNSYLNQGEIASPMMFIQQWLNDFSKANLTGLVTASAIVFAIVVIFFTAIEKIVTKDRKGGKDVYERRFNLFS